MTIDRDIFSKSIVMMAHPGHELRIYDWMATFKPSVHVLTTGSRSGELVGERLNKSRYNISLSGSRIGSVFGHTLDIDLYRRIFERDVAYFERLVDQFTKEIVDGKCQLVVCDCWQAFSVAHDLASVIGRVSAKLATQQTGDFVECLEYMPVPQFNDGLIKPGPLAFEHHVTPASRQTKTDLANEYPDLHELEEYIEIYGLEDLLREQFYWPKPIEALICSDSTPLYEIYGSERVAQGRYDRALSWADFKPIVELMLGFIPDPV